MQEKSNNEKQNNLAMDNAAELLWTNSDWIAGFGVGIIVATLFSLIHVICLSQ